ncbi:DoxX family membrane protein [Rubrivirga marina]|uniref:DoxX family protein n=1 Tax=Rubrivirga marina TaxID=1196024 RepID=A0A271IV37_9BACT|nr:DoxX family membrane protein [Rubrivirga marina]PAP75106.1 hypothetical protein BSZ37_00905 [Rubrivirga marina]
MTTRPLPEAAFRVLLSLIFLVSGATHLLRPEAVAARLDGAPFAHVATALAPSTSLVLLAGVALLAGGLALLVGYRTRAAALGLIAVLVPITLTVQLAPEALGPLFKNVAILGGLVFFAAHGSEGYSADRALRLRRARRLVPALS